MATILFSLPVLFQALAELYVIDGQYERAFSLYADVSLKLDLLDEVNIFVRIKE